MCSRFGNGFLSFRSAVAHLPDNSVVGAQGQARYPHEFNLFQLTASAGESLFCQWLLALYVLIREVQYSNGRHLKLRHLCEEVTFPGNKFNSHLVNSLNLLPEAVRAYSYGEILPVVLL